MRIEFDEFTVKNLVDMKIIEKPLDGNHGDIHPKGDDFIAFGVPFIMASDINNSQIDFTNCKFISKKQAANLRKGFSKSGDVLLTHKASIGRTAIVPNIEDEYILLTPQVTYYRVKDKSKLNNYYLKYYFDSKYFQSILLANAGAGSTRAYIGITEQLNLPIKLPDFSLQQKIASVLSALDAKIELNNRINAELEAMAKTLYDYWFVQFDFPDENGKPYKSSGGKMIWNDELKREIPSGWEVQDLSKAIEIKYGKDHKKLNFGSIPVFGSGGIMRYADKAIYEDESILIPRKGTLSNLFYLNKPFWSVDTMFFSKMKIAHIGKYLFYFLQSLNLASLNAGTAVPSLTTEILNQLKIVTPSPSILKRFETILTSAFEMKEQVTKENQQLANLRDWLLPMLMNGQVRVN